MAGPWFVRSGAGGSADGLSWGNAKLTLAAAFTAASAGDTIWVADDHAETGTAANNLQGPGTAASPCFVYCADHNIASPGTGDLKTTATITVSATNTLNLFGYWYCYGIIFTGGAATGVPLSVGSTNASQIVLDTCQLILSSVTTALLIRFGGASIESWIDLLNTTCKFAHAGQGFRVGSTNLRWRNGGGVDGAGTAPSTLFLTVSTVGSTIEMRGIDLSPVTGTLIGDANAPLNFYFTDCKLGAGVTVLGTQSALGRSQAYLTRCDSGATNYRQAKANYVGSLVQETTIVRSGGASDGTTSLSHKIVTTANSKWVLPFESFPIAIWNDTTGSGVTATVEIVAAGSLNNDDVWMEVEYLGSALTPQASFASNTKANNLATGTALTSSTATWASSPGTAMKMSVSFTPQMKGYVYVRVYVAKASQTLYVDPVITLS
jgi:hypothetical protein